MFRHIAPQRHRLLAAAASFVLLAAGLAFGVFQQVGATTTATVVYNSTLNPLPGNMPGLGLDASGTSEFGNEINLAPTTAPLSDVVVTMSSGACETGGGTTCATTPGATFSLPITLTVYNAGPDGAVGSVITSDTQTFDIPFRPSVSASCTGSSVGAWFDAATSICYNGIADNITFDSFSGVPVALPGTVIYGIAFSTENSGPSPEGPYDSLNVALNTSDVSPTTGSDTYPGTTDLDSQSPSSYCDNGAAGTGTFRIDSPLPSNPAACASSQGGWSVNGSGAPYYVPAVQFITTTTAPGAPTSVSAIAGNASATVSWSDPAWNGGSDVTSYTVNATDSTAIANGGQICTAAGATASFCTVSGLTSGDSYSYTVTATNSAGTGAASSASNSVTMSAPASTTPTTPTPPTTPTTPTTLPPATAAPPPPGDSSIGLGTPTSSTAQTGAMTTVMQTSSGASASISIPSGALPVGTIVSVYPVTNTTMLTAQVPAGQSYVVSFAISWMAPNGTSPNATAPITMTVDDLSIAAGDTVYEFTPKGGLHAVGTASTNGVVTITFSNDPVFVITAMPKLSLAASLGRIRGNDVEVTLHCAADTLCRGSANLSVARDSTQGKKIMVTHLIVASATFSLAKGETNTVAFPITARGKTVLSRRMLSRHFRVSLMTVVTGGAKSVQPVFVS